MNELPGAFGPRGHDFLGYKRLLQHSPHRLRLAWVVVFYCMVTGFVGASVGAMIGGCLGAGLHVSGFETPSQVLGLSATRFSSLIYLIIIGAFSAAGVWYGLRKVDVEVSKRDPTPLQ
jgi:hypothetical protein